MKTQVDLTTCPLLSLRDIGELCRNYDLARRGLHHGWLKPRVKTADSNRGLNLYTRHDVDAFLARIMSGEVPPLLPRNRRQETP